MPGPPTWEKTTDPDTDSNVVTATSAAGAVVCYGTDRIIEWMFNFTATAIVAGDAVQQDATTTLPTTGQYANTQPGLACKQTAATAGLDGFLGVALDDIPAAAGGIPGRGRVIRRGCIRGTVGFKSSASIARGVILQTVATAGTLGTRTVDTSRNIGITLAASSAGGVGSCRLF